MIDKNLLKDIFPFKRQLILVMISNIMQAMMIVAIAYIIAYIADKLLLSRLESSTATPLLVLLFFFFCIKAMLNYFNHYQMEKISLNVQSNLRKQLFEVLAQRNFLANSYAKGQWIALITKGVDKLDIYLTSFIPQLGLLSTIPLILLIFTFINDWISGLIFLITAPLIPFFMILIGKIADKENKKQWQVFQKLTMYMADLLPGLLIVKAYNQTQRQLSEINKNGKLFSQATLKVLRIAFISAFMLEFISTLSIAIIAVNIGLRLIYGHVEFLPVFFILLIAPQFYQPFRQFGSAFHDAMNGITASSEIYAMIDKLNCIKESKANLKFDDADMVQIELKNVYYKYQDNDKWAIDDLSLKIEKGKQFVLTGDNGAGKSTLFKLLLGIEKCQSGEILINDYNLADLDKQWWQSQIGWVAQEPYIFSATISENITLSRDFNLKEIEHICQLVNLDEFIKSMPQGYDTEITSAMNLSSGQKRRLGLARALIGRPKLLLLDEPMENLDVYNEKLIQRILSDLNNKVTVIIIGHRLQTLKNADELIYLQQGKLADNEKIKDKINYFSEIIEGERSI
ncbi:thiol reductant ABC exporter subunit CydD [Megamonas funiformis]|uniref:thiol reductant ABC exporter subunit CydD n=1 Tax=Megamonas funiformis TaxID=437897 RepID=UPI00265F7A3F|nr:thiol reductant ABC exporter subunit CydD [Megamonas funiformis]